MLSAQSKEENRKLISETFDIYNEDADLVAKPVETKKKSSKPASCVSEECEYDSDGDHQHIIEHIQRNR